MPKILEWKAQASNPVGAEYIIMEHVDGINLHEKWPEMSTEEQLKCTSAVVRYIKEMATISFGGYGSLYFEDVDFDMNLRVPVSPGYVLGPTTAATYWNSDIREPRYYEKSSPNRGPCEHYFSSIL